LDKQSNQINNIQSGTVVDTDIVSRHGFNFYLNTDTTVQGTSRPTFYQVLHNQIGFTPDEIQQLTYYLCHTDVLCTKAVSVPLPIHNLSIKHDMNNQADPPKNMNNQADPPKNMNNQADPHKNINKHGVRKGQTFHKKQWSFNQKI